MVYIINWQHLRKEGLTLFPLVRISSLRLEVEKTKVNQKKKKELFQCKRIFALYIDDPHNPTENEFLEHNGRFINEKDE